MKLWNSMLADHGKGINWTTDPHSLGIIREAAKQLYRDRLHWKDREHGPTYLGECVLRHPLVTHMPHRMRKTTEDHNPCRLIAGGRVLISGICERAGTSYFGLNIEAVLYYGKDDDDDLVPVSVVGADVLGVSCVKLINIHPSQFYDLTLYQDLDPRRMTWTKEM